MRGCRNLNYASLIAEFQTESALAGTSVMSPADSYHHPTATFC